MSWLKEKQAIFEILAIALKQAYIINSITKVTQNTILELLQKDAETFYKEK